jgi:hypothetical protein
MFVIEQHCPHYDEHCACNTTGYAKVSELARHEEDKRLKRVCVYIQDVQRGKASIMVGHSIVHSKQKSIYVHVSYSEPFPR